MQRKRTAIILAFLMAAANLGGLWTADPAQADAADGPQALAGMAYARPATGFTIDGALAEGSWAPASAAVHYTTGSASDNAVTFDTAWDSSNLYVAVKVLDDRIVNNGHDNLYEDDSVEIFLDGDNGKRSAYDTNDYQLFIRSNNDVKVTRSNAAVTLAGLETAVAPIAGGYTVEVKVPWSSLGVSADQGKFIGLDIANNDNDSTDGASGRSASLSWHATGNTNWSTPSTFGTLFLSGSREPVVSGEGTAETDGAPEEFGLDHVLTAGDNAVSFGSVNDRNYLYVGVSVTDGSLDPGDAVELFIDGDGSRSASYDAHDRHFVVAYGSPAVTEADGRSAAGVSAAVGHVSGGYAVEIAVPWTLLGIGPKDRSVLGFDLAVRDADNGGAPAAAYWSGSSANDAGTGSFGSLIVNNPNVETPPYTGPRGTLTDETADFSKVFDKSAHVTIENQRLDATPKFNNGWAPNQYVAYKSPGADLLSFDVEAVETGGCHLEFYASPDNAAYAKLVEGVHYKTTVAAPEASPEWYARNRYESLSLPQGTLYLKIVFTTGSSDGYKSYIATVGIDYRMAYDGPRVTVTDETDDLGKVLSSSFVYVSDGPNWFDSTNKFAAWDTGANVKYRSPSGDVLSFRMQTVELGNAPDPAFRLYESSDDSAYTEVAMTAALTDAASDATGWFARKEYVADRFKSGTKYIRIDYQTTADHYRAAIYSVSFDAVRTNAPPAAAKTQFAAIAAGAQASGAIHGADPDGDALTYSVAAQAQHGTVAVTDGTSGTWTYTPNEGFTGNDQFEIGIADGFGGTATTLVTVLVYDAPTRLSYYVSASGSDGNDGRSEKSAFRTLQRAHDVTKPGDTVYIMKGTYTDIGKAGDDGAALSITRSGSPDAYITYRNYPGHKPVVYGAGNIDNVIAVHASYIRIEGLEIVGGNDDITYEEAYARYEAVRPVVVSGTWDADWDWVRETNTSGIGIGPRKGTTVIPHHVEIRGNIVRDMPGGGIGTGHADYVTIENNQVYDNAKWTIWANSGISVYQPQDIDANTTDYKIVIRSNISRNNETTIPWVVLGHYSDGNGIIIDDAEHTQAAVKHPYRGKILIQNNLSYNNGGSGIHAYHSSNVDIINNTAYHNSNSPHLNYGEIFANSSRSVRIMNNIMVANGENVNGDYNNTDVVYSHNLFHNGTVVVPGEHTVHADPKFVNGTKRNFRLREDSPAIDAGTAAGAPAEDIAGKPRPAGAGFDIGAYEFLFEDDSKPNPGQKPPGGPKPRPSRP